MLKEKLNIIQGMKAGKNHIAISTAYGVDRSTVGKMLTNKHQIIQANRDRLEKRGKITRSKVFHKKSSEFDKVMFAWFNQQGDINTP